MVAPLQAGRIQKEITLRPHQRPAPRSAAIIEPRIGGVAAIAKQVHVGIPDSCWIKTRPGLANQRMPRHFVRQRSQAGIEHTLLRPRPPGSEAGDTGKAGKGKKAAAGNHTRASSHKKVIGKSIRPFPAFSGAESL
jgi:hypothetical protein